VVDGANQGCQNASKGCLKALYAPQIYPRLINRAQFIVYSFTVDVFDPHISYPKRNSFGIYWNFFLNLSIKNPWCEKNIFLFLILLNDP
jgi:hypothetical protein